jgi:uracil-DNA glycosylase
MNLKEKMTACMQCDRGRVAQFRELGSGERLFNVLVVTDQPLQKGTDCWRLLETLLSWNDFNIKNKIGYTSFVKCFSASAVMPDHLNACLPILKQQLQCCSHDFIVLIFSRHCDAALEGNFYEGFHKGGRYFAMFRPLEDYLEEPDRLYGMFDKLF